MGTSTTTKQVRYGGKLIPGPAGLGGPSAGSASVPAAAGGARAAGLPGRTAVVRRGAKTCFSKT
eukprot:7829850-Lingulodinium_polyedra.AAC.1